MSKRYCPVIKSIKESLKEVRDYKNGKKKLKTWEEYIKNGNSRGDPAIIFNAF